MKKVCFYIISLVSARMLAQGPPPPPGVPIDDDIYLLFVFALALVIITARYIAAKLKKTSGV